MNNAKTTGLIRRSLCFLAILIFCILSAVFVHADGFPNVYYRGSRVTIPGKVYYCLCMETGLEGASDASYTSENPSIVKIISQNVWNMDGVPLCIIEGQKIGSTHVIASVKSGSGTRTIKVPVDVINYANPLKSFTIGSTNLASRFDHCNYASYTGARGNQKISFSVESGWSIKVNYIYWDNNNIKTISVPDGGTADLNDIVSKADGILRINLQNSARGLYIEDIVIISDSNTAFTPIPTLSGGPVPTPTPVPSAKYTVTLNPNGSGAAVSKTSITVTKNNKYGTLPTPSRKGYTFQGWYTKASGGSKVTADTKVTASQKHTLYAHWKAIQYKIAFNKGNSKAAGSMKTITMTYDKAAQLTKVGFSFNGYHFKGWSKKSGGEVSYKDRQSVKNLSSKDGATVTLYAVWEKEYRLTVTAKDASNGKVLGNATVNVRSGKNNRTGTIAATGKTNSSGVAVFNLAKGDYTIQIRKSNFKDYYANHSVSSNKTATANVAPAASGTTCKISGTVRDAATGKIVADAQVDARSGKNNRTGKIIASTKTDNKGVYSLKLPKGDYTLAISKKNFVGYYVNVALTGNRTISTPITQTIASTKYRIVLSWAEKPKDLDLHITGPASGTSRFHTYWSKPKYTKNGVILSLLDVDDRSSYGPETITLDLSKEKAGTYHVYVHDYSDRKATSTTNLAKSGARIDIYSGSKLLATYSVPNSAGTVWQVCDLVNGQLKAVKKMGYDSSILTK